MVVGVDLPPWDVIQVVKEAFGRAKDPSVSSSFSAMMSFFKFDPTSEV